MNNNLDFDNMTESERDFYRSNFPDTHEYNIRARSSQSKIQRAATEEAAQEKQEWRQDRIRTRRLSWAALIVAILSLLVACLALLLQKN